HAPGLSGASSAGTVQGSQNRKDACVSYQPNSLTGIDDLRPVQKPLAGRAFLQVDQTASPDQAVLWHLRERGEDTDLDRCVGLCAARHRPEAPEAGCLTLHIDAG